MRRFLHRSTRMKEGNETKLEHRRALDGGAKETDAPRSNIATSHPQPSKSTIVKSSDLTSPPATVSPGDELSPYPTPDQIQGTSLPTSNVREQAANPASSSVGDGNVTKKDYWRLAIEKLQEEDPAVGGQIIGLRKAAAESGGSDSITQLLDATKQSHQELEAKRWKIPTRSGEWVLRDQLDRILKVVTVFKDMGSAAASLDPVHAGLPLAGFCVLMQMATSDSEQYAAMVAGVDEVITIVARYRRVEELYLREARTALKPEFEQCLVSLYKHIVRYQISAACYYRRNTMLRILRSIPQLDNLSDVVAAIRRDDTACGKISQVFDASDARDRYREQHRELFERWDRLEKHLMKQTSPDSLSQPGHSHWIVARSRNGLFTGREDILQEVEAVIRDAVGDATHSRSCRIVISGMGGQGKSEICLQIAHCVRDDFWGVFWVDVSNATVAESGYSNIAATLGVAAQKVEDAKQALSNVKYRWLLVLDNADDPNVDYQHYVPDGFLGVVILTSRNEVCHQYATVKPIALEGLAEEEARELLLKAAQIPSDQRHLLQDGAGVVARLLQSHPLALIQAGAYISRGHCTLAHYPSVYERQRQRLLAFRPQQARSRYGDVYATFEASAELLKTAATDAANAAKETARDALELLPLLAVCGPTQLPMALLELAWERAKNVPLDMDDDAEDDNVVLLTPWHVSRLPSFLNVVGGEWDSFRVVEAVQLLKSLSLVSLESHGENMNVSMHPLIHAWARDRQDGAQQHDSWLQMGCVMAFATIDLRWEEYDRQLQPHVEALTAWDVDSMFGQEPAAMVSRVLLRCGWELHRMRADVNLFELMNNIFRRVALDRGEIEGGWTGMYDLAGRNLLNHGQVKKAVDLLEKVVKIREQSLKEDHPDRLASQHALAGAYEANGQVKEAVDLLEKVVKIREQSLKEDHPSRLASQHALAGAYEANGQVKEAVDLLEKVVKIREQSLKEDHPSRLASQHALAGVYEANGQIKKAVDLLEKVVKIKEQSLKEDHPDRLVSQHNLATYLWKLGSLQPALDMMARVVEIRKRALDEDHPDRKDSEAWLKIFKELTELELG